MDKLALRNRGVGQKKNSGPLLLGLVDGGHCWWRLWRTGAVGLHLGLQAKAVLADAVASLLLGVWLIFLGGLLSTPTLWVSL